MTDLRSSVATESEVVEITGQPEALQWEHNPAQPPPSDDARDGDDSGRSGDRSGRVIHLPDIPVLRVIALAITGIGVLLVLFLVYLILFTPLTASRNQQRLVGDTVGRPLRVYSLVSGHLPPEGQPVAVLEIPAVGLRQVVVQGTSAADLMNGPGLMPGTSLPGSPGNSVIAGRRVTFGAPFGSLDTLRRGDRITTVDGVGTFVYKVERLRTVTAGQRDVITPTTENRLTLVTSNSSWVTSGRLVVTAKLVGTPVAVPSATEAVPSYELGLTGDPSAGGLAVLWSLVTVVVVVVAGIVAWRWRRPWLVYLLAAPVVVACGLFACESVARALPATF